MEILKYLQELEKDIEKEWLDILLYNVRRRYGPVTKVEHKTGNNGMPYTVVTRGRY